MKVMEGLLLLLLVAPFSNTAASEENIDLGIQASDPDLLEENERLVRQMPGSNEDHRHAHPHPDTSPQVEYGPTSFDPSAQPHPATGYGMPGDQPYSGSGYPIPGAQPYPASGYPIPGAQPYPPSDYPIPGAQPYPPSSYPIPGAQPYPASGYPIPGAQPYPGSGYGPPVEQPYSAAGFAPAPQYAPDAGYAPGPQYDPISAPQYTPDAGHAPGPQYAPLPAPQYAPDARYAPGPQYAPLPAPQYAPDGGYAPVPQYAPLPAPQYAHVPSYVPPPVHGVAPASVYPGEPAYAPAPQYVPEAGYPPAPVVAPAPFYAPGYMPAPAIQPPVQVLPGYVQPTAVGGCHTCGASVVPSYTTRLQARYVPGASYRQLMCGQKVTCGYRIVTRPGSYVYYRTYVPMPVPQPLPLPYPLPGPVPLPQPLPYPLPGPVPLPQPLPYPLPVPLPQPLPYPLPQPRPIVIIRPAPVPPRVTYACPQSTCPQQPVSGGCGYVQPAGPPACATHQGCQMGQQCCYDQIRGGLVCGQGIATTLRARRHMQIVSPMSGPSRVELLIGQWRDRNVTSLVTQWLLPLKMDLEDFIEISFATRTKCRGRGVDCTSAKVLNCIVDIEEHAFNNTRTSPEDEESRRVTREALFSDLSMEYGGNSHEFFESPSAGDWLQSHDEFLDTLHEDQYYQNAWQLHNASGVTSDNAASNIDYIFQPDFENLSQRNYNSYAEHQDLAPEAVNQGLLLKEVPEKEDQSLFHQGLAPDAVHHSLAPEAVFPGLLHPGLTPEAVHQSVVLPQSLTPDVVDERLLPQSDSLANEKQVRLLSFAACLLQSVQAGVAERKKSALLAAKRCVRAYGYDWQRVRRCTAQDDAHHEGGDEGLDLNGGPVEVTVNEVLIEAEGNLELSLCYTLNKFGIEPVLCDMLYDRLDEQREKENGQSGNGEENGASHQTENVLVGDSSGLESPDIAGYTVTRDKNSNDEIIVPIYRKDSP